ncbi:hypothetical protein [Priestia megaterium]|uniref:hypothetical protein n=1 Tax=Priestia megaterium TaxID=1404 RepID=UPI000BF80979|nr:hypothetical protein [Priestia megaterium]PFR95950.1 hypothetical protein COK39_09920 [Priestia megaterium]
MTEGQGEDSCGKSASDEEAHRPPAETSVFCAKIKCSVTSCSAHVSYLFVFRLNSFRYVSISFFME